MWCIDCGTRIRHKGVCDDCLRVRVKLRAKTPETEFEPPGKIIRPVSRAPAEFRPWQERSKKSLENLKKYEVSRQQPTTPVKYDDPLLNKKITIHI